MVEGFLCIKRRRKSLESPRGSGLFLYYVEKIRYETGKVHKKSFGNAQILKAKIVHILMRNTVDK